MKLQIENKEMKLQFSAIQIVLLAYTFKQELIKLSKFALVLKFLVTQDKTTNNIDNCNLFINYLDRKLILPLFINYIDKN